MVNLPQNPRQELDLTSFSASHGQPVEWRISDAPVPYPEAVAAMEARVAAIAAQQAPELVWLLEHPPLYTSGTSGKAGDLLDPRFPLFSTGRGGQVTVVEGQVRQRHVRVTDPGCEFHGTLHMLLGPGYERTLLGGVTDEGAGELAQRAAVVKVRPRKIRIQPQ